MTGEPGLGCCGAALLEGALTTDEVGEAEIVQHGGDEQQFGVPVEAVPGSQGGAE